MVNARLVVFSVMLIIAMIAVQAEAALTAADPMAGGLMMAEPNVLLLMLLAAIVAFATAAMHGAAPVRRRRVNRARMRARRAGS
jgi:uncharacterized membrane protein YjgN (DUF898 family)